MIPAARESLARTRRLVVKVGSRVLVQRTGRPDPRRMSAVVNDLATLNRSNRDVVLVSSGAVGAGMQALGMTRRPTTIPDLQMAAAVGQSRLMTTYDRLFSQLRCRTGQVLLTHGDLKDRRRHLNARHTLMRLLDHRIIPVINENDVVSIDELKFGDNDRLAALVAILLQADLLVLLTTSNGLRQPAGDNRTRRIPTLQEISPEVLALVHGGGDPLATGGMASKLDAARTAADNGIPVVIADGRKPGTILRIARGEDVGTLLLPPARQSSLPGRKRWIAFFHKTQGTLHVDEGAVRALTLLGKSLLPIGIRSVEGEFAVGTLVGVAGPDGLPVAHGLTDYDSTDLRRIMGKRTAEIAGILGSKDYDEAIHRDNLVMLTNAGSPRNPPGEGDT